MRVGLGDRPVSWAFLTSYTCGRPARTCRVFTTEQDNHNVALREKVQETSPRRLPDDGATDRCSFPFLNLGFCFRFVGSGQTAPAGSSPSLPAAARAAPSLTGHLHEVGQPPVGVVHQQDAVLAQTHASQKQHHHLLKLVLPDAACGGAGPASSPPPRGARPAPPSSQRPRLLTEQRQQPEDRAAGFGHLHVRGVGGQQLGDDDRGLLQGGAHDDSRN